MRNIKLNLQYAGTKYAGWQIQNRTKVKDLRSKKITIQEIIENILRKILQEKVRLIAAGRTDAGVHAKGQVANFKTHSKISLEKLQTALNGLLPKDISVSKIEEVAEDFHARYSAKSKEYRYTILNSPHRNALLREYAYFCRYRLNKALIRKEAKALLGTHDFSAFCASGSNRKNKVRTIKRLGIACERDLIHFDIEADGFLYNMVRNIVGTLIEIGRGRFPEGSLRKILESRDRKLAGPTVPARGLSLIKVNY